MSNTIEPWGLELINISEQPNSGLEESIKDSFLKVNTNLNILGQHIRYKLTFNLFLYVNANEGNDSNNGLSATEAFETMDKALAFMRLVDTNGYFVSIVLADGTYTSRLAIVSNQLNKVGIIGNVNDPSKVIWKLDYINEYCIKCTFPNIIDIKGITFQADSTTLAAAEEETKVCYLKFEGCQFYFSDCVFNDLDRTKLNSSHISATDGAKGNIYRQYTIAGSARYHISLDKHSSLLYSPSTSFINIFVSNTSTFSYIYSLTNSSVVVFHDKYYYNTDQGVNLAGGFYTIDLTSKVENKINLPTNINNISIIGTNLGESTCETPATNLNNKNIVNTEWVNKFFLETVKPQLELLIKQATGEEVEFPFIPVGTILPYAGSQAPGGFLLCNGTQVSKTTYAALYAVVKDNYGTATSTLFTLPDLRGRVLQGVNTNNTVFSYSSLGAKGGAETRVISTDQLPEHTHTILSSPHSHIIVDPGHFHSITDRGHSHPLYNEVNSDSGTTIEGAANLGLANSSYNAYDVITPESYTGITETKITTSNISLEDTNLDIVAAVSGQSVPFDVRQPYLTVQYIIKF